MLIFHLSVYEENESILLVLEYYLTTTFNQIRLSTFWEITALINPRRSWLQRHVDTSSGSPNIPTTLGWAPSVAEYEYGSENEIAKWYCEFYSHVSRILSPYVRRTESQHSVSHSIQRRSIRHYRQYFLFHERWSSCLFPHDQEEIEKPANSPVPLHTQRFQ